MRAIGSYFCGIFWDIDITNIHVVLWEVVLCLKIPLVNSLGFRNYFSWCITLFCKIVNCFAQLSCFTHTTELSNNPLMLRGNQRRTILSQLLTQNLKIIHPPRNFLVFLLTSVNFDFEIHCGPTSIMLPSTLREI